MIETALSIGIATKNRWDDLEKTLAKLAGFGLSKVPIYIFDDGSDGPCPFSINDCYPNVKVKRFEASEGYIVRRNQLAQEIQTKYYLSLDDDSYPVSGSLAAAIDFLEKKENILCLSLSVYNPTTKRFENESFQDSPYQVRSFIGCGHILYRQNFLSLGGYSEQLVHQGEEMDVAARGFQKGLYCYHFPALKIHHTASDVGRNWHRMDYYGARNNILWNDWFVPSSMKGIKQMRTSVGRSALACKVRRAGQLQGMIDGFKSISDYKKKRESMDIATYRHWNRLPIR